MNDVTSPSPPTTDAAPEQDGFVLGRVIAVSGTRVSGIFHNDKKVMAAGGVQIGSLVKMRTASSSVYGIVSGLRLTDPALLADEIEGMVDIELICESIDAKDDGAPTFQRGVSIYPMLGAGILGTRREEIGAIYARPRAANVRVGTLYQDSMLPAYLVTDELLAKHFAILGTTGSGKSCTVALILHRILEHNPNGRIILLDPHDEYSKAFGDLAEVIDPGNLHLPYWLLNFEETAAVMVGGDMADREADIAILKAAILHAKQKYCALAGSDDYVTIDTPVPYRFGDLIKSIDGALGKLDKPEGAAPFLRIKARLDALRSDRRFAFMFSGFTVADNMADVLGRLLRIPVLGRPVSIIDLSGVPSEIVDAVVSVMCRMIFDFALWNVRPQAFPVLLVCEEAHRYVSADPTVGFGPTRRSIARIAKEGRKYGVSLCLVSQRPSELDPTILSQCNTLFALRMGNERDHKFVHDALPEGSLGLLGALPSLKVQEAVVVGEGVTVPMRVRFDDLDDVLRPRSGSASFSQAWQGEDEGHEQIVAETIERWRRQIR